MSTIPAKNCQEFHHLNQKIKEETKDRVVLIVKKRKVQNITKMGFEEPKIKSMSL